MKYFRTVAGPLCQNVKIYHKRKFCTFNFCVSIRNINVPIMRNYEKKNREKTLTVKLENGNPLKLL